MDRLKELLHHVLQSVRNMSLARKFGAISAILIIGFAALGLAYYQVSVVNSSANNDIAEITHFGEISDQINIQFLEMRRLEKDFIIDHDTSLLEPHKAALTKVEGLIAELLENPPTEETAELVEEMSLYLGIYGGSFIEMAASMERAGLDNESGFLGQLMSSAANMKDMVSFGGSAELENSLLKMREFERAYIEEPLAEYGEQMEAEKNVFQDVLAESSLDEDSQMFIRDDLDVYKEAFFQYGESVNQLQEERDTFAYVASEFSPILETLRTTKQTLLDESQANALASRTQISIIFVVIIVLIGSIVSLAFFGLSRMIRAPLQQAADLSAAIANGQFDNTVEIKAKDETGELLQGLVTMQDQLREQQEQLQKQMEEDRRQAEESAKRAEQAAQRATETGRIKEALDGVSSSVLMLDEKLEIIYHNNAALAMFRDGQSSIRRDLPGFDADNLMGQGFDYLYTNAAEEGRALKGLTQTSTTEKQLGDRVYRITVSPVVNNEGARIGTVAEWVDRTVEIAVEEEVQTIVTAAKSGDLSQRLVVENKQGFFHALSIGVNELVDVSAKAIQDTVDVLGGLSTGDLTKTIDGDYEGVYAQLKTDVNATVDKLTGVVSNIKSSSNAVADVATQIANSNSEVSSRTEQQSAALEETASAMEEMTATVRQTANNTNEANGLANETRSQAQAGGKVAEQAVTAMAGISDASNRISNIIGVIDEISFETNLLALNAAVEAARAGEQGRGFAVVATEIRSLAGNSAKAAKEIKDLIDDSNHQVQHGSKLVNESADALQAIVGSVEKVSTIIAEIATASHEQAEGIEQVNSSIANIDENTQQNAVVVEQVSEAGRMMGKEAESLNEMMSFFSVGEDQKSKTGKKSGGSARTSRRRNNVANINERNMTKGFSATGR